MVHGVGNRHLWWARFDIERLRSTATLTVSTFLLAEDSQHETRCRRRSDTLGNRTISVSAGISAFMRRWKSDELPQFWNVLKGDTNLVSSRRPAYNVAILNCRAVS